MVDGVGATAFTYTQVGRLASESNPFTSLSGAISYSYCPGPAHRVDFDATHRQLDAIVMVTIPVGA